MNLKQTRYELQNLISGKSASGYDSLIQAAARYLRGSEGTSTVAERKQHDKGKEAERLISFANAHNILIERIDESKFVSSGAEQKVFIQENQCVLKLNDAIYYEAWQDYLSNLLLHNYFFSDTAYELIGFYLENNNLFSVVSQLFVKSDKQTHLPDVSAFLLNNGFKNTRRNDYHHPELGIILEDLHDENVLTQQGVLYFIDTVFYINPEVFW